MDALIAAKVHPTAEQVYDAVREANPTISLGTIYKTLETFVEAELVNKVSTPQGQMRYDSNMAPHNHIYVTNTDEIVDFQDRGLHDLIQKYVAEKKIGNFNIKDIRLHIKGEKIDPEKDISIQ